MALRACETGHRATDRQAEAAWWHNMQPRTANQHNVCIQQDVVQCTSRRSEHAVAVKTGDTHYHSPGASAEPTGGVQYWQDAMQKLQLARCSDTK